MHTPGPNANLYDVCCCTFSWEWTQASVHLLTAWVQETTESILPQRRMRGPSGSSKYRCHFLHPLHLTGPASWYRREEVVFEPLPWHPTWQRSRSPGPDSQIRSSRFLPHRRKDAVVSQSLAPAWPLTLKCLENPPREVLVPACLPRAVLGKFPPP